MGDQDVHHGRLEGGRHIGNGDLLSLHPGRVEIVQDGGFHAAEGKVVAGPVHLSPGEMNGLRIPFLRHSVDLGTAGIPQADLSGHLVEGFPCRVVVGPAQDLIDAVVPDQDQVGMASRDHKAYEGRLQVPRGDIVGADVALDVMDPDQGKAGGKGKGLGLGHADQQGAHQARSVGDRDGVQVGKGLSGGGKGFLYHLVDPLRMFSGGDLRHHAPVEGMDVDLGRDDVGEDLSSVHHHGRGSLVAAGFYS